MASPLLLLYVADEKKVCSEPYYLSCFFRFALFVC